MLAEEIIQLIKNKGYGVLQSSLRTALVYLLNNEGYRNKDIANALGVRHNNINYYHEKANDLIFSKDKTFKVALEELQQHRIVLVPFFTEKIGNNRTIRIRVTIDNIKL